MTDSPSRRTKAAWLIGGVLLLGVGMLVLGNWDSLQVRYYVLRFKESIENNESKATKDYSKELTSFRERSVPAMIRLLKEPEFREEALSVLYLIWEPSTHALVEALSDEDPETRLAAAWAFSQVSFASSEYFGEVKDQLTRTLDDPDRRVRIQTAKVIDRFPGVATEKVELKAFAILENFEQEAENQE